MFSTPLSPYTATTSPSSRSVSMHWTVVTALGAVLLALALVATALWSPGPARAVVAETPIAADDVFETGSQRVAVSDDGSTIAYAWLMYDGSVMRVRTRYSTDGGRSWTNKNLSSSSADAEAPALAVSGDGQTILLGWRQVKRTGDGNVKTIRLASTTDGGQSWDTEQVSASGVRPASPAVAVDATGQHLAITWVERERDTADAPSVVQVRSSSDGGSSWQTEALSAADGYAVSPGVLFSSGAETIGYFWALVTDQGYEYWQVRYSTDGGATWTTDQATPADQFSYNFTAAVSGSGRTLAFAWAESDATGATQVKSRYTSDRGASWTSEAVSPATKNADDPQLAVDNSGEVIAMVWSYFGQRGIDSRYTRNGGATWTDFDPGGTGEEGQSPRAAVSGDGQTFSYSWASWQDGKAAYESRYSTDGGATWSPEKQMSKPVNAIGESATAVSGTGNLIAYTWTWDAGSANSTVQARYTRNQGGNWNKVNLSGSSAVKKLKVKASSITRTSATVTWKKPATVDSNGVKKYQVRYKVGKNGDWKKWKSATPKKLKIKKGKYGKKLTKLKADRNYVVQVRSKNSVGPGGVAVPVVVATAK
jgi:hypothetical protein